tara:strand:+ start:41 stop:553 length:513 start_codon:yes stop_codon:yes gene_type:complete
MSSPQIMQQILHYFSSCVLGDDEATKLIQTPGFVEEFNGVDATSRAQEDGKWIKKALQATFMDKQKRRGQRGGALVKINVDPTAWEVNEYVMKVFIKDYCDWLMNVYLKTKKGENLRLKKNTYKTWSSYKFTFDLDETSAHGATLNGYNKSNGKTITRPSPQYTRGYFNY